MKSPYDLSSINALVCFEAAARHLSFKKAAQEMNVTPAAISHRIKALEIDLGCRLFNRSNRGVELTEKGAFLVFALQRGFETISDTVTLLKDQPETVDVTIRTTTAVSSLWLIPKISQFWKSHPDITISQIVSDIPEMTARCDLSIQYSNPLEEGSENKKLFQGNIIAIGSRQFADDHQILSINDLLNVPLIHIQNDDTVWTSWTDWFHELEYPGPKGRSFYLNNYMIGLQAAQDDVGAILGWDRLVGKLLQDEQLVQLVPNSIPSPMGFYLNIHPRASEKARIFADWLLKAE
ncbi:LysR family transcriptional regulator [Sneathiella limimaris]|uniref:LysR family transcriptional regulator n=1 Tax=Sneathiella limimaris TaxID=1964213 RepID=UPI00146D5FAD|nr:LysR family transcriptional regulator [Sneathiella limimaris]